MTVHTVSKQKNGVFTLTAPNGEPVAFQCQQRNVRIVPPEVGDDAIEEVLDGTPLESEDQEKPWKLAFTAVQDFTNDEGFIVYSWDHQNEVNTFTWQPVGPTGPTYTGSVKVSALTVGGDINKRLDSEAEWPCTGKPVRTPGSGA